MRQTSLREVFTQTAVRFFGAHLSDRMKRLVHIASLGAYLKGSTSLDDATINKLNTVMVLGSNDKALKLPVLLSRAIWDGKVQTHDLSQEAALLITPDVVARMTAQFTEATPAWLRYGEQQQMQHDMEKLLALFKTQQEVTTPA